MTQQTSNLRALLLRGSTLNASSPHGLRPAIGLGGAVLLALASPALAQSVPLPTGGVFAAGSGTIQSTPTTMTITQSSGRGVIDWRDFSIGAEHQVQIDNASGTTLNRVMGGQLSRIEGSLSATGSVYLMNPAGVIVGPGGKVLTGGSFVASTRQIDAGAFMAGGAIAVSGNSPGEIVNQGSITAQSGSVVMIARAVTNQGTISAAQGRVTLAAADEVLLATTDGKADGIYVSVGAGEAGDVTQAGRIEAAAVALQAADGNIFALAGNRDGQVQATGTATIDGELWLTAQGGTVEVSGTLRAANADGSGGRVTVNGHDVALAATAEVSASGTHGGEVLIGTSAFASGDELAASTRIASGATITSGGPEGGGRIETSGLAMSVGEAQISAGEGGLWLLDPNDIVIDGAAASTITGTLNSGSDVLQQTTAGGTGGVGDISVNADLIWTGSGDLTLDAYRDVVVSNTISGGGSVTLLSGRDIHVGAAISGTAIDTTAVGATTIGAAGSLAASGNVTLETGTFVNQAGAGALNSSGGTWLVYSGDPANDTTGGLTPDFYQYAAPPGTTPAGPGNGLLYSVAPSVSFTLGPVVKEYDGTTDAVLDDSNVNVTGLINGDDFTLDGSYADRNAGTGIAVTATNFAANQGGVPVFGYNVTTPSVTDAVGTINPATLVAAIVGNPTKTYNASTTVSLTSANFELTGVAAGETITVNGAATAAYDSANAGSRTVSATFTTPNFSPGAGTVLTNYVLPTSATGAGLINLASLLISGVTANDKVYDSTTAATLSTGSATIFGVVTGDTVSLDASGASGVFATEDVGTAIAVTGTGFALAGADAPNYVIAQPTGLAANITPASLVVSGLEANDKVYDGTTTAALNTAGVQFTGLISGDEVTPGGAGAQVNFATKNAGINIPVTITGLTLSGADAGNYNVSYSGSLAADILQRQLTFNVTGTPTKVYDGTTNAVGWGSGFTLDNVVAGESVTVTQAADLQYASKNVGTWDVTGTLTPADYQAGPNTLLPNYILPTTVVTQGEITPAPLTIVIVDDPTKPYDGNADASLGPDNFAVSGFVFGEGAAVTQTDGQYASSDAGTWTVTANLDAGDFDPDAGTLMSNYLIPSPVYGPGTITRIPLGPGVVTVDITGNPSKIYDGTTVATLTSSDYTLGGFIAGEGATITETVGEYDSRNAGSRAVLVLLDPTDFDPDPGTNLANYTLPTQATGVGTIFQKQLTAAIIGNPTKVYNGTTRAVVASANYSITGAIAGESVTVAPGVVANYANADAGGHIITANFTSVSNFAFGTGTLGANYVLPTIAQGPGTITPAPLLVLGVSAQNKVYDQTTVATLTGSASLFGVVSGDTVLLQGGSAAGAFATPNVGNGIAVTVSGYGISGADASNYELFQPSGLNANITPRGLTIADVLAFDKVYDGTTVATLGGSQSLVGVLAGDTVLLNGAGSTAAFLQSNVGNDLRVNVGGFSIAGPDSGNYSLAQPSGLIADITPAPLTGAIIGNPTKTYDGTTQISLTAVNYSLSGFVTGEGGAIAQSSNSVYDSANAGPRAVSADVVVSDFVANSGTLLSNYLLPTSITGTGTITQAALIAKITGNPTKVYDSTTAATLTSANYLLQGFVGSEGATVTETGGTYDTKNVGSRTVTATLGSGDFTANGGTTLANYVLPTSASGAGTITPANVQVIGIVANDKVYDATTLATLDSTGGGLTGVFAGDTVNLVSTGASGTFATRNVGIDVPVTATGYTTSGADAGNYLVLQPFGLSADITQATIQLASVTKIYDALTPVPTVNSAYTLSGVFAGDSVGVNASGITGNYADKNVGAGKNVTLTGVALNGTDAPNYAIATGVTNAPIGIITPATLTVVGAVALDKTYDQNTIAQLDNTNTELDNVLGTDDVDLAFATTGNFNNANAGTNKPVTTTAYSISGADAGNYTLVQPQGLTADILQREIFLASVTKVYDGLTSLPTASSGYAFTGVLSGDTVTAQTSGVTGQYNDNKNVGTLKPVTVNGLTLTGASGGNYFIDPSVTDTIGTITQATLTVAIVGNPTKTYDGDADATLTSGDFAFTGFVLSEGATVTQTAGIYDSKNVDATSITADLVGFIDPDAGTLLTNYILPTSASGMGTIDPRLLTIAGVIAEDKVYDGNTDATLDSSGASLVDVVPGDTVALDSTVATGVFATEDVGTDIPVTASGYALLDNPFGNYLLEQPTGLLADITQAFITLTRVTKVYDATLALPTASSAYTLTGVVAGDDVSVDTAGIAGTYATKDVAPAINVTLTGLTLAGAEAGNYSISGSVLAQPIGEITPATLTAAILGTITKTYDGDAVATLTSTDYLLSGFAGTEGATVTQTAGTYNSANVVGATSVTATLTGFIAADLGTDLANYILPASATGTGAIDPATLAATIVGNPTKTYDGTAVATLAPANYQLTGFIGSESATVAETVGTYASANAGPRLVSVTLGAGDFAAGSGTLLSNYVLPTSAGGPGTIDQATLTAAIIGNPTKTYDGDTDATLASGNFQLTGFIGSEGATVTETAGLYDSANAGSRTVTATLGAGDFTATGTTLLANYVLPTGAAGAGTIDQATLIAVIIGTPTKTYDATTAATLTSANYQLTGFIGSESATVTETAGIYASANAGPRLVTATLTGADYAAGSGTLLANYVLPTSASGAGLINQATLSAAIVGNPTKTYDGTTTATLTSVNYRLTGLIGSESATVTETVGTYASANAGPRLVTASLAAGDFTAGSGTLLSNYVLPTSAAGLGTINQAILAASIVGIPTKTYDATTGIVLAPGDYALTGFVSGEGATITETAGVFGSPDAGIRQITATLAAADFAPTGSTALANYVLPTQATGAGLIERALLAAAIIGNPAKTYDATTSATLTSANYQLTGFVGTQGATVTKTTGLYDSANAGSRTVTASLGSADFTADVGTALTNYVLPTTASGAGTIDQALLTAAIIGNPKKTYDGNTAATLTSANYQLTGFVGSESAAVVETAGVYDSANAGARIVTAALGAGDFTAGSGTLLANYVLPTDASGAGTIGQAALTAAIVGNPTKTYDGTDVATLASANYQLTGFIGSESATVTETVGTYASPDAGSRLIIATLTGADFSAGSGTLLANYVLPTSASGIGTIDQATLTAAIIGNPTKTYDATDVATLTSANYQLTGFIGSEGATVTQTAGTYASPNAGLRIVTASLAAGDFSAGSGTLLSNYVLPTSASGLGAIDQATLAAIIVGNPTKTYDGTSAATLAPANYQLTGFVGSESATVTETAGTYASPNAGSRLVTATLAGSDFAAGSGTLLANYLLPTSASGLGTIDQALLAVAIIGTPTKTYDATDAATLTAANYDLTGFVTGEGATVTQTAGTYDSANAGPRTVTASLASGDFAATGSTLLTNYVLPTSASGAGLIDQATLAAIIVGNPTKTYDGTTAATLTSANYQLTGFIGSEGATVTEMAGTYASPNAGSRLVTATLTGTDFLAGSGTLLTNYALPTSASGLGTIDQALLTAAIVGNPTKTYDGTTGATLTSANYLLTGFVTGEGATVTETAGVYGSANAGVRTVSATLDSGDFAATGSTLLANYVLPTSASGLGTIDQAALTAAIIGNPTKTYDSTTAATLTSVNYQLTGFIGSEGATVTETVGVYGSANAGIRTVSATLDSGDFTATGSTLLANYLLPTSASGLGTIDQATLAVAIIGNPTKTYDGTTAATLTSANYQLTGFIGSESATVTETLGTYASADSGLRIVSTALDGGDYAAGAGTLLGNYVLPGSATGLGTIDQALLTAAIVGNPTKTYDGTDIATLTSANYQLTGFVGSENATVTQTAGTYASPNAGPRIVSATLAADDFTAGSGTLLSNYVLPASASGAGTIRQALLAAAISGNPTKVYDGNTGATLDSTNYLLTGFIGNESAIVTETLGTYDSANAGSRTVTATLASGDFTAAGGTLLANYVLPTTASGAGTIDQALLAATIIGNPTKAYDGTTLTTLTGANYQLTGFVTGEGATVTQTAGAYDSANAGVRTVNATLGGGDFAAAGTTLLSNYILPTSASGAGMIGKATLTAAIIGNPTKTYDGNTGATLTSANYQLTGFVTGEGATVTETAGLYDSANAGARIVTATLGGIDFAADGGTSLANYVLPTSASGSGTIDQALLAVAIIGNPTKTYDATTLATLTGANYQLTGFIGSEGATVTQTAGMYDSANAGSRTVTANLTAGDFGATGGTLLANYLLPTSATGAGTIDQALLTAAITGNPTRTYDGTTLATLASGDYTLTGFVAGESATVTETLGTYDSANAGTRAVGVALDAGDFSAATGTLLANYVLPTSASGAGTIDQALLTATIIGNPTKTYDATTVAILTSGNYQLSGFIAGEGATVTQTAGNYDSPNAGARTITTTLDSSDFAAAGSTLLSNYVLPTSATGAGTIDQALLMAAIIGNPTKTYDGNTGATLTSANYQLTGFTGSEGATITQITGTYDSANAGSRTVTANLAAGDFSATGGTLLANYLLPTSATGAGTIDQALLRVAIIGNPTKTYDGNTGAVLTSTNYQLTGFVTGEDAAVTETVGTYDSANAGSRTVTATLGASDFLATGSTLLGNYVLPATATGAGTIDQALLAVAIIGNPTKTYDGTSAATLTAGNYALTGFVAGEGATVTQTAGSYDSANAGARGVTATLAAGDFAATGSTLLSNYVLPTSATGAGTIDQALLTAAIIGNPTRVYDATAVASLTSGNYQLTGFVAGEGATVTQTAGTYDSANAGTRTVTALLGLGDFSATGSTLLSNYVLPTSANGAGTIDQALLIAAIVGNPLKTYDGTALAQLTPADFALTGFIAGEGASVTQPLGIYDSPNAGVRAVATILTAGDFVANGGTLLSNYILPTSATGPGTILPRAISQRLVGAEIINDPTKIYDGTRIATLTPENFALEGFVGDDGAIVTQTAGLYSSAHVGRPFVTALLSRDDFTPTGDTLLSNYILPDNARGLGTILPAPLELVIVGNPTRVYDGTLAALLTPDNFFFTGFVAGEGATVTQAAGLYDSANAGARTVSATLTGLDYAANGGTLLADYVLPTSATGPGAITQALLTAAIIGNPTKVFDATTAAMLAPGNYTLTGFVAGEGATVTQTAGAYDTPDAGARIVTASLAPGDLVGNASTLLSNYALPTSASGAGTIDPKEITVVVLDVPTKIYDGTVAAELDLDEVRLIGVVGDNSISVDAVIPGTYNGTDVGLHTVTIGPDNFVLSAAAGTSLSNYVIRQSVNAVGQITPAPITATLIDLLKTYDGTTGVTLAPTNFQLTGFVGGEGAMVTETAGLFASPNAGQQQVTALLDLSDFVANAGTLFSNYSLPTMASGLGTIDPALLTVAIIGNPTRVYDGTAIASLGSANFGLTGFIAGESATVTQTVGTYDSVNAGGRTATASLAPSQFTASGGTLLSNYVLPTSAGGPGTINRAPVAVAIIGNPTKPYDGNTNATLIPSYYSLTGFVAGEGASVTQAFGTYAAPDVGPQAVTATLALADYAVDSGTLLSNYTLPTSATGPGTITEGGVGPNPLCPVYTCFPDISFTFAVNSLARFYIVYPSLFARYQGNTNAFAGLPSILAPRVVIRTSDGWLVVLGSTVVNSPEQILVRGGGSTTVSVHYDPPPVDTTGVQP